jgi:hypothetical protein
MTTFTNYIDFVDALTPVDDYDKEITRAANVCIEIFGDYGLTAARTHQDAEAARIARAFQLGAGGETNTHTYISDRIEEII